MRHKKTNNLREVIAQITKAKNENDKEKMLDLFAPDFVAHIAGYSHPLDREEYIHAIQSLHEGFSNIEFIMEDTIKEGNKIAIRMLAKGKHTGGYQGHEATQMEVNYYGIIMLQIIDGKVVKEWQVSDSLTLLRQIGLSVNHII